VKSKVVFSAGVALIVGSTAACAGQAAATRETGMLAPGTAQLTIDGKDLPVTRAVNCAPPEQYLSTITTGDDASGATVMVSNAGNLIVELVRIRNLNGFSGDYDRKLGGEATVALSDNTYRIAGTALGYGPNSPEPTTQSFTIKVSC
jgi:ipoprotein LpqH